MLRSFLIISRGMWEPIGVMFAVSLVWSFIRIVFCGEWRNAIRWCWLLGGIGAWWWRLANRVTGMRYHNIFLFIALFCIIDLFESFPLPRVFKRLLFAVWLLCCLVHTLIYHPQDQEICRFYEAIRRDAAQYRRPIGISYDNNSARHRHYTELTMYGPDRQQPLTELVRGLKGNLSVYDGDFDAVYLLFGVKQSEMALLPELAKLMPPETWQSLGMVWMNRYHKRATVVYRYLPAAARTVPAGGKLLPNGDFARGATPEQRQKLLDGLGKRTPRLHDRSFDPPADWNFYVSWGGKNSSFFTRKKRGKTYVLRMEARGYLCAISPQVAIREEKKLNFSIRAESDALLQISRTLGTGLFPIAVLPLRAGEEKRYEITLPADPGITMSNLWFWLDHGTVELRDVRMR